MAISDRSLGSELLKRQYSPSFWARSASSGRRSQGSNGPRRPPRGPATMASAAFFWSGVSLLRSSGARRGMKVFSRVFVDRSERAAGIGDAALVGVGENGIDHVGAGLLGI